MSAPSVGAHAQRDDATASLRRDAERAVRAGCAHLASQQTELGSWAGNYSGPMFLLPMYVAVAYFAEHELPAEKRDAMAQYLRYAQNADGSIGVYEGGPGCVFTSSLAYVALRLLGARSDDASAAKMSAWVREHGSPLFAAPWGKFTLALLDLYDYEGLDPITPEMWLLPYSLPFHPGRIWCHARQVYLPMGYLYGRRARRAANDLVRSIRDELYGVGAYARIDWKSHRATTASTDAYRPPTAWLSVVNRILGAYEQIASRSLRERAIEETFRQIEYEDRVTEFVRIGPVNAVLNTAVHAERDPGGTNVTASFRALEQYLWRGAHGIEMQGYESSQLWDTVFAMQSVLATPCADAFAPMLERAHAYVRDNQILHDPPDAEMHYRDRSRGGWPFSRRAQGWPTTDCTAEGFATALALERAVARPVEEARLIDAVEWMLSYQNADGGWGSYERQRTGAWLEKLNPSQVFGDIMVDYSFTECTSAVVQALVKARKRFPGRFDERIDRAVAHGSEFVRGKQDASGGWEGSWGVCFTYGTWFGVSGLLAAGATTEDPAITRACRFLAGHQSADGSWGERPESCLQRRYVAHERGQVVMTSWALLTLVRARHRDRAGTARAARFLVERQREDGGWARESVAGVFNRTCMINYDNYRSYFPVWALGEWLAAG